MKSEKEKMLDGELYDPLDVQLTAERRRARLLIKALNDTSEDQQQERALLIRELIPASGSGISCTSARIRTDTDRCGRLSAFPGGS